MKYHSEAASLRMVRRSSSNQHPDLIAGRNNANITSGITAGCTFSRGGFPGPYDASAPASSSITPGQEMGTPNFYYDPCAYSMPPLAPEGLSGGFYGNVGRNTLLGPRFRQYGYQHIENDAGRD